MIFSLQLSQTVASPPTASKNEQAGESYQCASLEVETQMFPFAGETAGQLLSRERRESFAVWMS